MMNLRHFLTILILWISLASLTSCEHRVLTDPINVHYVRVYLDENIKNVTYGFYNDTYEHPEFTKPLNVRAVLASTETGIVTSEGILKNQGKDERGNYIEGYIGAPAGEYHLMMYQLGSPITHIRYPNNYYDMLAYTDPISDRVLNYVSSITKVLETDKIMLEPQHVLVSREEDIEIVASPQIDTLKTAQGDYFTASTIAKSYYLQMRITGVEWVKTAAAILSGMSGSYRLCEPDGMVVNDPVNLFFSMTYGDRKKRSGEKGSTAVLYTTFTTFGKIPDLGSELTLNFEFTKTDGSIQTESFDLTEVFKTPMAIEEQWLILDKEINISRPEGTGGLDPGVEGWDEVDADLYM
jgi:hypothetical protein